MIYNNTGNILARYTYDEWGSLLNITGSNTDLANTNPICYRGYYFDNETNYYYLQSRYYDSSICRFINSDIAVKESESTKKYAKGFGSFLSFIEFFANIDSAGSGRLSKKEDMILATVSLITDVFSIFIPLKTGSILVSATGDILPKIIILRVNGWIL